jgi:hypothetical protein
VYVKFRQPTREEEGKGMTMAMAAKTVESGVRAVRGTRVWSMYQRAAYGLLLRFTGPGPFTRTTDRPLDFFVPDRTTAA